MKKNASNNLFCVNIEGDLNEEDLKVAQEFIETLKDEKREYDFDNLMSVYNALFEQDYTYSPVKETKYKDLTFRDVIKKFDNPKFHKLPKEDIVALCSEVNQKISKTLKIEPSNIKYVHKLFNPQGIQMLCHGNQNVIEVIKHPGKYSSHGYNYLFNILHETYHSYQFQQIDRFRKNLPFDKSCVIAKVNSIMNDVDLYHESANYDKKKKKNEIDYNYSVDLLETSANLFAYKMMGKLFERKYLTNEQAYNYNSASTGSCLNLQMNFRDDNFDNIMKKAMKNFRRLENSKKFFEKYFTDLFNYSMDLLFCHIDQDCIKDELDRMYNDISGIRINERLKTKFLENLTLKDYFKLSSKVCKQELDVKFVPVEEARNRHYLYMTKNIDLPFGRDLEEEAKTTKVADIKVQEKEEEMSK